VSGPVNFALAWRFGGLVSRPGPPAQSDEVAAITQDLKMAARRALFYVSEITGWTDAAAEASTAPILVLDRPGFIRANTQIIESLAPHVMPEKAPWPARQAAGFQIGTILAALSARILGQFDPFARPSGRLLLVAPNVLRFERLLDVPSADFRLWVTLHEQTHAVQFAAAPWLPGWLSAQLGEIAQAAQDDDESRLPELLRLAREIPKSLKENAPTSPLTEVLPERAREALARLTATMSLLEGHADVVMDGVGPRVVRSVEEIRSKFDARRVASGRLERAVRRLAGLEAKTAQYIEGAQFIRGVLAEVGHEGLAAAFAAPENLPHPTELDDPHAWVTRVHRPT